MNNVSVEALEKYYDYLAEAIDSVDQDNISLFLTKVCLLNFNAIQDLEVALANVDAAKVFYQE